jgi:hypothetical protein
MDKNKFFEKILAPLIAKRLKELPQNREYFGDITKTGILVGEKRRIHDCGGIGCDLLWHSHPVVGVRKHLVEIGSYLSFGDLCVYKRTAGDCSYLFHRSRLYKFVFTKTVDIDSAIAANNKYVEKKTTKNYIELFEGLGIKRERIL